MTTAVEVANIGLKRLLVQAADAPLAADEYADFYTAMNHFMAELEADGIVLGYTNVSAAADEVTIPDGAINAIAHNVAVQVAPDYGATVSPSLAMAARNGMRVLRKIVRKPVRVQIHPSTPRGAGNFLDYTGYLSPVYGRTAHAVLTLAGNTKATVISASATPVKANGFWKLGVIEGLDADITGKVTNSSEAEISVNIKVTLTAKATGSVSAATIAIVKNGDTTDIPSSQFITPALSATQSSHTLRVPLRLQPEEYVELWVADIFGTENITVTDAVMEVN